MAHQPPAPAHPLVRPHLAEAGHLGFMVAETMNRELLIVEFESETYRVWL